MTVKIALIAAENSALSSYFKYIQIINSYSKLKQHFTILLFLLYLVNIRDFFQKQYKYLLFYTNYSLWTPRLVGEQLNIENINSNLKMKVMF